MHQHSDETERLAEAILAYVEARFRLDPVPLDGAMSHAEITRLAGQTITEDGIGGKAALELFGDVLARACLSIDHPRSLSFIPAAPTEAATLFDLVVGASSIYGGSWLEGAGAVYAENQALRWIADLGGCPREPAACSCRAARSATCRRSSPRGTQPACVESTRRPRGGRSPRPAARIRRSRPRRV